MLLLSASQLIILIQLKCTFVCHKSVSFLDDNYNLNIIVLQRIYYFDVHNVISTS